MKKLVSFTLDERFRSKILVTAKCWLWTGNFFSNGYGLFPLCGRHLLAHRLSYEIHRGFIPAGLTIDHLCRNRACVNPDHLEAVTQKENNLRAETVSTKNAKKTHCPKGHKYEGENIKPIRNGKTCRACANAAGRAIRLKFGDKYNQARKDRMLSDSEYREKRLRQKREAYSRNKEKQKEIIQ